MLQNTKVEIKVSQKVKLPECVDFCRHLAHTHRVPFSKRHKKSCAKCSCMRLVMYIERCGALPSLFYLLLIIIFLL